MHKSLGTRLTVGYKGNPFQGGKGVACCITVDLGVW